MNIKLHTVISDITGQTGTAIIEAIISGERKAESFLPLIGKRIKVDPETILESLQGDWKEEHLFTYGAKHNNPIIFIFLLVRRKERNTTDNEDTHRGSLTLRTRTKAKEFI
jgi:hypothetical protein